MNLNDQQKNIVFNSLGKVAVVAGAGAGKSTTNIELIAKLHLENKIPLEKMFISTFTNKSGRDLKIKLSKKLNLDFKKLEKLWVGTFHSLGYRYLTQYRNIKMEIILPLEARQYLKNIYSQVLKDFGVSEEKFSFSNMLECLDKKRSKDCAWEDVTDFPKVSAEVFNTYQKEKNKMGLVDYEDILEIFLEEIKKDSQFSQKFDWVFVDESQDNSKKQNEIADALTNKNIVLIGDPKQSIYGFRGAAPELFKQKIKTSEKVFNLSYNYRSSKEIIDFANAILAEVPSFKDQELIPTKNSYGKPTFTLCDFQHQEVMSNIEKDIKKGIPLHEIAVLGRSIKPRSFEKLQILLRSKNIPYVVRGGDDKLNSSYIQNYLSVLKSVIKPTKISLTNSLGLLPSIGPKTAMKLAEEVINAGGSFDPLVNCSGKFVTTKAYNDFIDLEKISYDKKELLEKSLNFIYKYFLIPNYGKKDPVLASQKKQIIYDSLHNYLMESPSISEGIDALYLNEDDPESDLGKIVISTIHQSKGLEWDSVHILNLKEKSIPNLKDDEENNIERFEEEFCLFYVAVTRARKHLNLYTSFLNDDYDPKPNKLSRFIKNIYLKNKEKYFNFRILGVDSESKYKEGLYNKLRESYGQ
jgi:DNA helicase-2/ATP-dependent DNA helicase PcrA